MKIVIGLKQPPGMKQADFLKWKEKMQKLCLSMSDLESYETTSLLELADIRRQNTGEHFNICVAQVLAKSNLNDKGVKVIKGFLNINKGIYLRHLHEIMLDLKLTMINKGANNANS